MSKQFEDWFEEKYGWVSTRDPMAWQHKMTCHSWARAAWEEATSRARDTYEPRVYEDDDCPHCDEQHEIFDKHHEDFPQYITCPHCNGTGKQS